MLSDMCIYSVCRHIVDNIETLVGQKKLKKKAIGTTVNPSCHFGHAGLRFDSPGIGDSHCDMHWLFPPAAVTLFVVGPLE